MNYQLDQNSLEYIESLDAPAGLALLAELDFKWALEGCMIAARGLPITDCWNDRQASAYRAYINDAYYDRWVAEDCPLSGARWDGMRGGTLMEDRDDHIGE